MQPKLRPKIIRRKVGIAKNEKKLNRVQEKQNKIEKKENPKEHRRLVKLSRKLPHNQDLGNISKTGQEYISEKVPKRDRRAVERALKQELKLMNKTKRIKK